MPTAREERFVDLIHLVTTAPGDRVPTIHCNKMRPQPVNKTTIEPDGITCRRCRERIIKEAFQHAKIRT